MKKAFIAGCLLLCLIPSVGMFFFPTTKTSENKALAEPPKTLSLQVFREFEDWFTQRMALRNPLVYADAKLQSVFGVSSVDGVILGQNGWLYYSATLNDYLGTQVLSERELFNLAHNFSLIEQYLQERDIDFALTIAPNKNTLYGQYMPYYAGIAQEGDHSAQLLKEYLQVNYLDLFALFEQQKEILYLKSDSHWNGKGAYLVYAALMENLGLEAKDFGQPQAYQRTDGDLSRMLYSFYGAAETDYAYQVGQWGDVEKGWLTTENPQGTGTLVMFRDSFANNLIPFFSETFQNAYYSKGQPNLLESYVEQYQPDVVVIQKVERNITDYLQTPPVITAPQTQLPDRIVIAKTQTTLNWETASNDTRYWQISGQVDEAWLEPDARIVVRVGDRYYDAYHTGEFGFLLYVKNTEPIENVQVYLVTDDSCVQVAAKS